MKRALPLALLAAGLVLTSACGDPCVDLSKKVCSCERTAAEQQACSQRVDNDTVEATNKQKDVCTEHLDTCSCEALARGELTACGLAHDAQ
jgi:hypothetical protein